MNFRYDPVAVSTSEDPGPAYKLLRDDAPIFWSDTLECWVVSQFEDCRTVVLDSATFASDWRRAGMESVNRHPTMQELDPPASTELRKLFRAAWTRQDSASVSRIACELSQEYLSTVPADRSFDFTVDVAQPVALGVVARTLGIPAPPIAEFSSLVEIVTLGMDSTAEQDAVLSARQQLSALIRGWFSTAATDGMLQTIVDDSMMGLRRSEVWDNARVYLLASFGTTVGALANAALALARDETLQTQLLDDGRVPAAAVEELLRFAGPVQGTTRACVSDTAIHDVQVRRGQPVLALIAAANRDDRIFTDPESVMLQRTSNPHLALGWGPHSCLGAQLARITIDAVLSTLVARGKFCVGGPPIRKRRATLRYPDHLPLRYITRKAA